MTNIEKLIKESGKKLTKISAETGIAYPTLSGYNQGIRTPKKENAKILADYFGVSVPYLLGLDDNPQLTRKENEIMMFGKNNSQKDSKSMARLAKAAPTSELVEPLTISIKYHDGTIEVIDVTYNIEELQHLFAQAMQNGSELIFTDVNPVITINPRYIKKVIFTRK